MFVKQLSDLSINRYQEEIKSTHTYNQKSTESEINHYDLSYTYNRLIYTVE